MTRRDRNPRQRLDPRARREAILAAAAGVFARHGYAEATISAIAAGAESSEALVYRYFDGKESLYVELLRRAVDDLRARQAGALDALPDGVPARDRVRATTLVHLDHVAGPPTAWSLPLHRPGSEPEAAAALRAETRRDDVRRLRALLPARTDLRAEYALWGHLGFLDAACLRWVERGCPDDDRWPLVDAALGALEGALGDWGG